jgi:hypothetical protein
MGDGVGPQALQLLQSVESQQIPKTTVMYNRALKALAASNQHDKFQEVRVRPNDVSGRRSPRTAVCVRRGGARGGSV